MLDLNTAEMQVDWRECADTPFGIHDAQAVCLNGKVYAGGGSTSSSSTDYCILCYDLKMNLWKTIECPTCLSALTTYQGKLVLVGGKENDSDTNKLRSLEDDTNGSWWADELPPMATPRQEASAISIGNHLIVAGGRSIQLQSDLDTTEVFDGRQWSRAEPLPRPSHGVLKSTFHNGEWCLMGGDWNSPVLCTTMDLIATTGSCESEGGSVWKTLPKVPLRASSIIMCGNLLLAIGGIDSVYSPLSAVHVYGHRTGAQSWMHAVDFPEPIDSTCSIILPSKELLVVGGRSSYAWWSSSVYKATLRVPNLQQLCVMTITANNIEYSKLPPHLQKIVTSRN